MTERDCHTCEYKGVDGRCEPCCLCWHPHNSERPRWTPNEMERLRARVALLEKALKEACQYWGSDWCPKQAFGEKVLWVCDICTYNYGGCSSDDTPCWFIYWTKQEEQV